MDNTIKSITQAECPHCKKDFLVEFEMHPTVLSEVFTMEQMTASKEEVLREIKGMNIDPEKKENIISWVTSEDTIFGPAEVAKILNSLEELKK